MLRFRPVQKHKTQLPPETLTALFQTQWMEAEILMSEGCDDHILTIFSQYSKVNSRWAGTFGSYTPNAYIQANYQDSGLKLNSSFQMWCWFKIQKTYEK